MYILGIPALILIYFPNKERRKADGHKKVMNTESHVSF